MLSAIVLVLRSCGGLRRASASFVLLYCITLLSCLVAVIGVFVAAYYPYSTSGVAFVGIHGLLNLYVWTLAACFTPVEGGHAGEAPTKVPAVTATVAEDADLRGWSNSADTDFKAVEL